MTIPWRSRAVNFHHRKEDYRFTLFDHTNRERTERFAKLNRLCFPSKQDFAIMRVEVPARGGKSSCMVQKIDHVFVSY